MKVINLYEFINKKLPFPAVINKLIIEKYYDKDTLTSEKLRMYQLYKVSNLLNEDDQKEMKKYCKFLKMFEGAKFEVGKYYGHIDYIKVIKRTRCFITIETGKRYKIRINTMGVEYVKIKDMFDELAANPLPEDEVEFMKEYRKYGYLYFRKGVVLGVINKPRHLNL